MNFSNEELVNMIYVLGEAEKNCLLASRIYKQKYPLARHPRPEAFENVRSRFERNLSVAYVAKSYVHRHTTNEDAELPVLLAIEENPHLSVRQIALAQDISKSSVHRIIRKYKYHPYHLCLHQSLQEHDFQNRIDFCNLILGKTQENPNFYDIVLFSDEATFNNIGVVNKHNMHYYAQENPFWIRQVDFQHQWSLNVWAGIINNDVIGPFFFEGPLDGRRYLQFVQNDLPILMENIDLQTRQSMYLQHDGAPAHFHRTVRDYLNNWLGNRWIGRGGDISWPARSPDLTPLDFFLWGFTKQEVYRTAPTTAEDMKERIRTVFRGINCQILNNVKDNFMRRLHLCVQEGGNVFEHLM